MLVKYFDREGATFKIASSVRNQVQFRHHNLLDPAPLGGPFDIVFLRNVLIYFDVATKRDVLRRVRMSMAPDGYLLLGAAETTIGVDETWERIQVGSTSIYRPREGKTR